MKKLILLAILLSGLCAQASISNVVITATYRRKTGKTAIVRLHGNEFRLPASRIVFPKKPIPGELVDIYLNEREFYRVMSHDKRFSKVGKPQK